MEELSNEFYQQYRRDNNTNYLEILLLYENYQDDVVIVCITWNMDFPQYNNNTDIYNYSKITEYAIINNGHIYYTNVPYSG